jgi:hypothetical protein
MSLSSNGFVPSKRGKRGGKKAYRNPMGLSRQRSMG